MFQKRILLGMCLVFILAGIQTERVWAGDINSEEARVISYYSKTFYSDGKAYVASESAKAKAYERLSRDNVNLTAAQADNMITQMSVNVENGIKRGYLVPVDGESTQTSEKENPTENKNENNGGNGTDNADSNTINNNNNNSSNNNTGSNESSGTGANTGSGENGTNSGSDGQGSNANNSGSDSGSGSSSSKNSKRKTVEPAELAKELKQREKSGDKDALTISDNNGKKIRADEVENRWKTGPVTIKDYTEGVLRVVDNDGTVLYESTLPIRNTGTKSDPWFLFPLLLLAGFLLLAIFCFVKPTLDIHWAVGGGVLAVIVIAAAAVGGRNTIASFATDWKTAWITEAPEFRYQEEKKTEVRPEKAKPVLHQQYGLLRCVNIDMNVPMYYGDGDEELGKGVGIYPGYSLPGETGTTLIGGHDGTFFAPLEHVSQGDVIEVDTIIGTRYYSVVNTAVADASDEAKYAMQEKEDSLILYTCYPFGKAAADRSKRFYVYAEKMETGE